MCLYRQMTDNIFEMEATALSHVARATRDSGILLTDFACAYPSVNPELPRFRQGCPASGFLFAMAFYPIFRCLHGSMIPMNPGDPKFLHPLPRAYADDFAFAAPSFLSLMPALSPAFMAVDSIPSLNLNHWKCFWVQCGNHRYHELLDCFSTNCGEFPEMKIVKHANMWVP